MADQHDIGVRGVTGDGVERGLSVGHKGVDRVRQFTGLGHLGAVEGPLGAVGVGSAELRLLIEVEVGLAGADYLAENQGMIVVLAEQLRSGT